MIHELTLTSGQEISYETADPEPQTETPHDNWLGAIEQLDVKDTWRELNAGWGVPSPPAGRTHTRVNKDQ